MKNLLSFFKLTAMGGLLVLLPILLCILLLMEIVNLVVGLASPIADLFPTGTFGDPKYPLLLAIILLTGTSLLIGLAMRSDAAKRLGNWIQAKTIDKMPIYRFVKALVAGLVGAEKAANFKPALFDTANGQREIIYLIEDLGNGHFTALFPRAPSGFAGPVKIVAKDRLEPLDASLGDVSLVMSHMGLGAGKLLKLKKTDDGR